MDALDEALVAKQALLPPVVVTECLSARDVSDELTEFLLTMPTLTITDGYWERAAQLRRTVLDRGFKAALADTLISQSCLDHDVALVTRDRDFKPFAKFGGLKLA